MIGATAAWWALAIALAVGQAPATSHPPSPALDPVAPVQAREDAFWKAYNACDTAAFRAFFTADVEFYHDRGGPTIGLDALDTALAKNLCGSASKLRREAVPETLRWSILRSGDTIYGAIVAGEHVFYVREPGKAEFLDGRARFLTLWLLKDGAWKMARLVSYDHGPATRR
jgi:hypothetical protein